MESNTAVILSENSKIVNIVELRSSFEDDIHWGCEWKLEKYKEQKCAKETTECNIFPVEVACRSFIANVNVEISEVQRNE